MIDLPPGRVNTFFCPGADVLLSNLTFFSAGDSGFTSEDRLLLIAITVLIVIQICENTSIQKCCWQWKLGYVCVCHWLTNTRAFKLMCSRLCGLSGAVPFSKLFRDNRMALWRFCYTDFILAFTYFLKSKPVDLVRFRDFILWENFEYLKAMGSTSTSLSSF